MANIKVSEMTETSTFDDGDYTMIVQSNQSKKISRENIFGDIEDDISTNTNNISTIETNIGDLSNLETSNITSLVNAINSLLPVVLYNNVSGTTDNITLSETSANFEYIEVYWQSTSDVNAYGSVKVYNPDGKNVTITNTYYSGNTYGIYVYTKSILFSGTNVTVNNTGWQYIYGDRYNNNGDRIKIVRIVGYR